MKFIRYIILWILALQLLNMSICSEAYNSFYTENPFGSQADAQPADPTETIVEWLVELKMGQQDAFTYDQNNIDSKTTVKAIAFVVDLENYRPVYLTFKESCKAIFAKCHSKCQDTSLDIFSPPPEERFS